MQETTAQPAASLENAESLATPQFKIFPNPTTGKVNIQKSATDADYEVKVLNTLGQVVQTTTMKKAELKVEFSLAGVVPRQLCYTRCIGQRHNHP